MAGPATLVRTPTPDPSEYVCVQEMTAQEFLDWEHTGFAEWIDGKAYQYMPATDNHQSIVLFLAALMDQFVFLKGLGRILLAPYSLQGRTGGPVREPDIMFVANDNLVNMRKTHIEGPCDIAIEVISDDSPRRDRADKFDEYAAAGVREYWLIDSRTGHSSAFFFALRDGEYQPLVVDAGVFRSAVLEGFWLRTEWLWAERRNTLGAIIEVVGIEAISLGGPRV